MVRVPSLVKLDTRPHFTLDPYHPQKGFWQLLWGSWLERGLAVFIGLQHST